MNLEALFNREAVIDLSFFNFRNAVTAGYFADAELRVKRVNANFRAFFPVLGNVSDAYFPDVLAQLGVDAATIRSFAETLEAKGQVLIPHLPIRIEGRERAFALLSTRTRDDSFSFLNGVQGQLVDRTAEFELRHERERLLEERLRDREAIEAKTRQLEALANKLAKYLSPQIYGSIFSGTTDTRQGFARKTLTVFFSDLAGFTELSERLEPERLAFVVNTYLTEMARIALEHGGTIDKFIGDAMLVFFGDPETQGEAGDALRCARMALAMRDRLVELDSLWRARGIGRPLRARMGINTGYCTVGNFGSEQRLDYTALGGPVNLAARLQAAAEPGSILLGETTRLLLKDAARGAPAGEIEAKGLARPVATYRLEGLASGAADDGARPLSRIGRHVAVNVPDDRRIREAIEELKRIQDEFQALLRE
ncbi:MAG: adenylate/guanylate cyclase domain-containing protein [Alphaproteobacteria bacterium]|nr:adenylate/guanylate cyclase domain-containing protein [Alphaproteobacteria bacterium]